MQADLSHRIQEAIENVRDQQAFIQNLLIETLGWQIPHEAESIENISYDWPVDELGQAGLNKSLVDGSIYQIQPMSDSQPWGIFILEFQNQEVFTIGRGLTGPLRKILRCLVPKRRRNPDRPTWDRDHLLFICTHNYEYYRFAYFKSPKQQNCVEPLVMFGWEPGIRARTVCEFNLPNLVWPENHDDSNNWTHLWQQAFDKQKLTEKFFDEYKAVFDIFTNDLALQTKNKRWAHDYALQFLNRCMFLYFIQRKGWLGQDKEFLNTFWQSYKNSKQPKDTFFEKWISILFFEAFNNKFHGGHVQFPDKIREILEFAPFLNGGLFKSNKLDNGYSFNITDDRFGQIIEFLDGYNFTINEDTPLEIEVAVDAEMLGMVYETLVNTSEEEDRRGEGGIFYTPRVEIDLMCRLALSDYLANHIGDKHKDFLYDWIFNYGSHENSEVDKHIQIHKLTDPLIELLSNIKVVDPACGSGSFLVGMLYILDDLLQYLERKKSQAHSLYDRRKEIIGSSLYGVDVKDWACHVAELRLWLALIIDADLTQAQLHVRNKPLLPNFSFNIRCGDSLVQQVGGIDMAHRRGSTELTHRIKLKLNDLKNEKVKFYNNDHERMYETAEQLEQQEVLIFREILEDRISSFETQIKNLMRIQVEKTPQQQRNLITGELEGPAKQYTIECQKREKEIIALSEEKQRLEVTHNSIRNKANLPFVWDIAFAEVTSDGKDGFDIVIGNPPYVRQEKIADPRLPREDVTTENKREYKSHLARSVYKTYPKYFAYKEGRDKAKFKLNAKSDLYIYFYFLSLSLLNPEGSFCFITSNSWLDVGYGKDLQEFLIKRCHVKLIIDNKTKRSFKSADVNTIIALLSPPQDKNIPDTVNLEKIARFAMLEVPFEQIVEPEKIKQINNATERTKNDKFRIFPISQQQLLEDGYEIEEKHEKSSKAKENIYSLKGVKYIGNKWGGKYLKAPDIYWSILEKYGNKFITLNQAAKICRGITTGCNEFFFLELTGEKSQDGFVHLVNGDGWSGILEKDVLRFGVQKVIECETPLFRPKKVLFCPPDQPPEYAKKYIQHGEDMGYGKRPTCKARDKWWKLHPQNQETLVIGFNYNIHDTGRSYISTELPTYYSDSFHILNTVSPKALHLYMRSTLLHFFVNIDARTVFGGGKAKLQTYELGRLYCIKDFELISENKHFFDTYEKLCNLEEHFLIEELTGPVQRIIDEIVFDIIGFSIEERNAVYDAVINLIEYRLKKAESLKSDHLAKRLDAVEKTTGIWTQIPDELINQDKED